MRSPKETWNFRQIPTFFAARRLYEQRASSARQSIRDFRKSALPSEADIVWTLIVGRSLSRSRAGASTRLKRAARRLPFGVHGGRSEQADDGAHTAAQFCDASSGERGGRARHSGSDRSCQPGEHGALHPGRHQDAEPDRSAPPGGRAARLSGHHGCDRGGGGYLPPSRATGSGGLGAEDAVGDQPQQGGLPRRGGSPGLEAGDCAEDGLGTRGLKRDAGRGVPLPV